MNKLFFLLLPLLLATTATSAQGSPRDDDRPTYERPERGTPEQREGRFNRIRAARRAYLVERLALTEKEATAFFPIYWAYDEQMREARWISFEGQKNPTETTNLTELEARELLLKDRTYRQEMLTLRNQTEDKLLKILPAAKIIRIPEIEKEFRRKLWDRARGRRGGR